MSTRFKLLLKELGPPKEDCVAADWTAVYGFEPPPPKCTDIRTIGETCASLLGQVAGICGDVDAVIPASNAIKRFSTLVLCDRTIRGVRGQSTNDCIFIEKDMLALGSAVDSPSRLIDLQEQISTRKKPLLEEAKELPEQGMHRAMNGYGDRLTYRSSVKVTQLNFLNPVVQWCTFEHQLRALWAKVELCPPEAKDQLIGVMMSDGETGNRTQNLLHLTRAESSMLRRCHTTRPYPQGSIAGSML